MQDIVTLIAVLICTSSGQQLEGVGVQGFRIQQPALSVARLQDEAMNPMRKKQQPLSDSNHLTNQQIPNNIYEPEQLQQQFSDAINSKPFRGPLLVVDAQLPTKDGQPPFNSIYSVEEMQTQQQIQQAALQPLSLLTGSTVSGDLDVGNSNPNGLSSDSVHSIPRTSFIVPSPRDDENKNEILIFPDDDVGSESLLLEHVRPSHGEHAGNKNKVYDNLQTDFVELKRVVEETRVDCKNDYMTVTFKFSSPFSGVIYPYQHFSECMLLRGHNQRSAVLTLRDGFCGRDTRASASEGGGGVDRAVFEHRLVVQWEAQFVSEEDTSVVVRCDRPHHYNRTVSWTIGAIDLPSSVHHGSSSGLWPDSFSSSSSRGSHGKHPGPQLWMTIAHGEGPDAPSLKAEDVVHVGDALTIVFTLSDPAFWFDSNILSCYAFDGSGERKRPQWEDAATVHPQHAYSSHMVVVENGCSTKRKLFSHFIKQRKIGVDGTKTSVNYAHFKAFRFPTSLKLQIECDVEVCYERCREMNPCSVGFQPRRRRRSMGAEASDAAHQLDRVRFRRSLDVYMMGSPNDENPPVATDIQYEYPDLTCYPSKVFFGTVISLAVCVVIMALLLLLLCSFRSSGVRPVFLTPGKSLR